MSDTPYVARRESRSEFIPVRGLSYHVRHWGDASLVTAERPPLVMVHGWMDVGASFQFVVDALADDRYVVAPDWRGFGLTDTPQEDSYWFADYLGDLDALIDATLKPFAGLTQVDLVGHSMGGNVVMIRLRGLALSGTVVRKGCTRPEGGLNRSESAVAPRTARRNRAPYHRTHE